MTNQIYVPNFYIKLDQEQDRRVFKEFLAAKNPTIAVMMPQIKVPRDVDDAIDFVYSQWRDKLDDVVNWLENNVPVLKKLVIEISKLLDCDWQGIEQVTIYPAVCPVCPRDINDSSFMFNFAFYKNTVLRVAAHEMTHFLYFKKLSELMKEKIETEHPSFDWLLSEITAPLIVNDPTIQNIIQEKDELYVPDRSIISNEQLQQIEKLFYQEKNLLQFREKAQKIIGQK